MLFRSVFKLTVTGVVVPIVSVPDELETFNQLDVLTRLQEMEPALPLESVNAVFAGNTYRLYAAMPVKPLAGEITSGSTAVLTAAAYSAGVPSAGSAAILS